MCQLRVPDFPIDCSPFKPGVERSLDWRRTEECGQWVFDDVVYQETVVTKFGLVCQKYTKALKIPAPIDVLLPQQSLQVTSWHGEHRDVRDRRCGDGLFVRHLRT